MLASDDDETTLSLAALEDRQALEAEIRRMKGKGVDVLQQVTVERGKAPVTYTYFDTEPEGKFASCGFPPWWRDSWISVSARPGTSFE